MLQECGSKRNEEHRKAKYLGSHKGPRCEFIHDAFQL